MNKHIISDNSTHQILIEDISPYGNLVAYVESDKRTCYFYLMPIDNGEKINFKPSALWLRNLVPAPEEFKLEIAPLMPKKNTKHPNGIEEYEPKELNIVWFSDGCGATLYYQGTIEAIIPPWSSFDNIAGYSREAIGFDTPFLPLPETNSAFYLRINENLEYWNQLTQNPELRFENYKNNLLNKYINIFDNTPPTEIYTIKNDFFLKAEIIEFFYKNYYIYITVGLSRHPLPKVEFFYKTKESIEGNRVIELFLIHPNKISGKLLNVLGSFATYPWRTLNFIDYHHSFEYIYDDLYDGFFTLPLEQLTEKFMLNDIYKKFIELFPNIKFIGLLPATQEDFLVSRGKGIDFAIKKRLTKV